jgi:hypothetical protein
MTKTELGKKLGFGLGYVANLFDFSKQSISVEAMESVLDTLGYSLTLDAIKR